MKVETPQILWNSEGDKGKNAPLYSIAMQESGVDRDGTYSHVLTTAGNTNTINLWKVTFTGSKPNASIFQKSTKPLNRIEYLTSLSRHELPVNSVAFSPDGLHLVTAGESGNIVLWSVPVSKRGGGNGRHYWSTVTKENELTVRVLSTHCEGVCDISWSADSKRFVVGTIDSNVLIFEDKHHALNQASPETHQKDSEWQIVFRNGEHSSFVQGVSYDPLGVYIASMGSDRTVRVFPRKAPTKSKKKVLRPANAARTVTPPQEHQRLVERLLTDSKLEMGKTKRIQRRSLQVDETGTQVKQRLFVDESTCESFFRRLCWTADGLFLITPCALWHEDHNDVSPSFSTYLFARHRFDEPYKVLPGLEKPSVVVRPNPVLFEMPESELESSKENLSPQGGPSYRSIFAVLTLDSVFIYDTHHDTPLSVVRGLHYAGLTDCCWSQDGRNLMVCSTDGYISILSFENGELGRVYKHASTAMQTDSSQPISSPEVSTNLGTIVQPEELPVIPPCEPGQAAVLEAPPTKRAKKTRVAPTFVSAIGSTPSDQSKSALSSSNGAVAPNSKRSITSDTEKVGDAVNKLSLGGHGNPQTQPAKKKKRIQPLLISN